MNLDLGHTQLSKTNKGIVEVTCTEYTYDVNSVYEIVNAIGVLSAQNKTKVLIIANEFSNIEKEAREFMASDDAKIYTKVEAFVIHSLGQKILANFYLKVNKPNIPSMFFNNSSKAREWLTNYNSF